LEERGLKLSERIDIEPALVHLPPRPRLVRATLTERRLTALHDLPRPLVRQHPGRDIPAALRAPRAHVPAHLHVLAHRSPHLSPPPPPPPPTTRPTRTAPRRSRRPAPDAEPPAAPTPPPPPTDPPPPHEARSRREH